MSSDSHQPWQSPEPAPPTVQGPAQRDDQRGQQARDSDATRPVPAWQPPAPGRVPGRVPGPVPGSPPQGSPAPANPPQNNPAQNNPAQNNPARADRGWQPAQDEPTRVDQSGRPLAEQTRFDRPWQPQDTPPPADRQWQPPPPPAAQANPTPPQAPGGRRRAKPRRVRRSVMALFGVIVLVILLVVADRVALAVTENKMASQFQSSGFPVKPSVTIQGFPFLTQLVGKDFQQVDISASNIPAGPVTISTVHATATGMHISGFSSNATATIDKLTATAFISNQALEGAGGLTSLANITATQVGNNILKVTASVGGVVSDTEELQITQTGPQTITVKVLPSSGGIGSDIGNAIGDALGNATGNAVSGALSSLSTFSFNLPKGVPASLRITSLQLNSAGLTVSAAATNATFSQ